MNEAEFRAAIVAEAKSWIGTPYHPNGKVKGAGVNCAQFAFCVGRNAGVLGAETPEPRWYTPQLAANSKEERLIAYIKAYGATEIPEGQVAPGDVVAYKSGLSHGHLAIVIDWPRIIHVLPGAGCQMGNVDEGRLAAFSRRYFTLWRKR